MNEARRYPVDETVVSQGVKMDDDLGGMCFNAYLYENPASNGLSGLLGRIGWIFDDSCRYAPNSERLLSGAKNAGLRIRLCEEVNEEGDIPHKPYVAALVDGCHPVGVDNLLHYVHDIGLDHITAPLVVGQEVFELLNLGGEEERIDHYDSLTALISSDVSYFLRHSQEPYNILVDTRDAIEELLGIEESASRTAKLEKLARAGLERLEAI